MKYSDFIFDKYGIEAATGFFKAVNDKIVCNGASVPDVSRVIFSTSRKPVDPEDKQAGTYPVLATTVFFSDGTSTTVCNSVHDKIELKDGVASDSAKEAGVIAAIVKRVYGTINWSTMKAEGNGFGAKLRKIVADGWDQELEAKRAKEKREKQRAQNIAKQKAEQKAAHDRLIQRLVREAENYEEAMAVLDAKRKSAKEKQKLLQECSCSDECSHSKKPTEECACKRGTSGFSEMSYSEKKLHWNNLANS